MAVTINSNIASLNALRRLGDSSRTLLRSFERLSSGLRINRPSDDAAGLAIASDLNVSSRVFNRGIQNANDGIGMLNVAEGSLQELSGVLVRIRELATQSANGTLSNTQRSSLNTEAQSLRLEYNRIIRATQFNGLNIHSANQSQTRIQMGYGSNGGIGFTLGDELERAVALGTHGAGNVVAQGGDGDVVLGDFSGEGDLDLFGFTTGSNSVAFSTGHGDGTFTFKGSVVIPGTVTAFDVGDINGDSRLDIAVGASNGNVYTYLGDGSGVFAFSGTHAINSSGRPINDLKLADLNNDKSLDIAVAATTIVGGVGMVAFSDGFGSFTAPFILPQIVTSGSELALGDFNGDGFSDLAVTSGLSSSVFIYLQVPPSALPNFTYAGAHTGILTGQDIASGDMNNDGYDDLVLGSGAAVSVRLGVGNGTFSTATAFPISSALTDLELADIDDDGNLDIVSSGTSNTTVSFGNGDGTVQARITTANGVTSQNMALGDLNGDGVEDLVLGAVGVSFGFLFNMDQVTTLKGFSLLTRAHALSSFSIIDEAMERLTSELGVIGAATSRISSGVNALSQAAEDYKTSESRIMDADVADESATLLKSQILQQAGSAILGQANLLPSLALLLLDFNSPTARRGLGR